MGLRHRKNNIEGFTLIKKLIAPLLATMLILIAFAGVAAGEQALAANIEVPIQDTTNGTIFLQLMHYPNNATSVSTNSVNHAALGQAIYETKQYRCFDRDTNETLPYYIRMIPTIPGAVCFDIYIGVGNVSIETSNKKNISFEYDPYNTYDIQNKSAVLDVFGPFIATTNAQPQSFVTPGVAFTHATIYNATLGTTYNASYLNGSIQFKAGRYLGNRSSYVVVRANTSLTGVTSIYQTNVYANTPFNAMIGLAGWPDAERRVANQFVANVGGVWSIFSEPGVGFVWDSGFVNPVGVGTLNYIENTSNLTLNRSKSASFTIGGGIYNIGNVILFNESTFMGAPGCWVLNSTFYNTTTPEWNLVVSGPQDVKVSDIATYTATIYPVNKPVRWYINGTAYSVVNETNNTITVKFHNTNMSTQNFTLSAVCSTYSLDVAYRINATMPTLSLRWLENGSHVVNGTRSYFYNATTYDSVRQFEVYYSNESAWDDNSAVYNWTSSASYRTNAVFGSIHFFAPAAADPAAWIDVQVTRNGVVLNQFNSTLRRLLPLDGVQAEPHAPNNVTFVESTFDNISFTWHSAPGNLPLTLEVTTDDSFSAITGLTESVAGNSSDGGIFTIPATALEAGTYFWRLVFPDGTFSNVFNFTIAQYHDYGDIGIQVIDADTQIVIPNATVSMGSLNGSVPLVGTTNETGWVFFENVTDGYMAYINASGYVEDQLQVMPGNNYTVQLARTGTTATIYFSLIDNSGQFSQKTSYLEIYYNDTVAETAYFDVSGTATATLRVGRNYSITIVNGNASRALGFLVPTGNQTIRLVVGDLLLQQVDPFWLNYTVQLIQTKNTSNTPGGTGFSQYTYNTSIKLEWEWNESAVVVVGPHQLYPLNVYVTYDDGFDEPEWFRFESKRGSEIIPIESGRDQDGVVRVDISYTDASGQRVENTLYITLDKIMYENLNISEKTRNLMCLCFLFIIALLFSPVNAQIGAVITVATAGILYALGLLIITPAVLFFVAFIPIAAIFGNKYLRGG